MTPIAQRSSFVDYLKEIDTPTLANAIELLKVRPRSEGFAPHQIRCLYPELGRMCGYAVTAEVETMTLGTPRDEDSFVSLFEAVEKSPKPAVIVFQEVGPHASFAAHCGEVMATIFSALGGIGLVSDCAVRDLAEVRALGFHYFAAGAVASHANFHIVRTGGPVHVRGLAVRSGDVLHGDENGVIQIPEEAREESLREAVQSVRSRERKLMDFAKSQGFTAAQLKGRFFH